MKQFLRNVEEVTELLSLFSGYGHCTFVNVFKRSIPTKSFWFRIPILIKKFHSYHLVNCTTFSVEKTRDWVFLVSFYLTFSLWVSRNMHISRHFISFCNYSFFLLNVFHVPPFEGIPNFVFFSWIVSTTDSFE